MHLSRFFQLKPIVRWGFRGVKNRIPYIPNQSLLLNTTILNDTDTYLTFLVLVGLTPGWQSEEILVELKIENN